MKSWFPTFRRVFGADLPLPSLFPPYTTTSQRRSLMRLIAAALESNIPLPPLLESWAKDERGIQQARLWRLVKLLKNGQPLADAMEAIPGLTRDEDVLALRLDAHSGTRTAALRGSLEEPLSEQPSHVSLVRRPTVYLCIVMPIFLFFYTFIQLKIAPVFYRMFEEFGLPIPRILGLSAQFGNTVVQYWWLVAMVAVFAFWSASTNRGSRFVRRGFLARWLQSLRQIRTADVLHHLGVAVQAGRPIPGALSTLARYHFDPAIRNQLLFLRNELEQGAELWTTMQVVGLLTPAEMRLMKTAERIGNRAWVLKQLALVKKRRASRKTRRTAELLLPLVVLLVGVLVLFYALSVFQPLMRLIEGWL